MKLPFADLRQLTPDAARRDLLAALTVTFLAVPQAIAYAMIAGLPPVVGLYATFLPAIVGALFKSSRLVITGPSNALSLLIGSGVAAHVAASSGVDPTAAAIGAATAMALMVGVFQIAAGALRLGVIVDYISAPVVAGYIAGAGVLIGVGQLSNLTSTASGHGTVPLVLLGWFRGLGAASAWTVGVGLGCAALILVLRRVHPRIPGPLIAIALATVGSHLAGLRERGVATIADLASIPHGLPPFALPELGALQALLPLAVAATVLSLLESAAVARSLAAKTGESLDISTEFLGQGLANVVAAVSSSYPTSASLGRTLLNYQSGATTRLSGILLGVFIGLALLFAGPAINAAPICALAGLLLVIAYDLVDIKRIRRLVVGRPSDALAFAATLLGTWLLPLDKAIYLGVGLSLVFYLRRARQLRTGYLRMNEDGRFVESKELPEGDTIIIAVDGQLFFASAGELEAAIDQALARTSTRVVILRLRRAIGMDATVADRLGEIAAELRTSKRRLILTGVGADNRRVLERTGALEKIGAANVYAPSERLLDGLTAALRDSKET